MLNRLMNPVPMSGNAISRFRWVVVAVAAALLIVPLAVRSQSELAVAPSDLAATIGDSTVTLSWTNPNDSSINKYQISTDGGSSFINIQCGNSMATGYTVMGLTNGTTYTFRVRAYDDSGPGASNTVTATPLFDAPTTLEAWPGDGYVALRWDELDDSRISGYEVSSDGGTNYSWVEDRGHESLTIGYSVLDLNNGTNYTIAVRAVYGAAATLNATPLIEALSRLGATPGYGRVTLSWRDPKDSDIIKYQFSSDGGNSYTSVLSNSNDLISYTENDLDFIKYTITNLTNDTLYNFVLRTANTADTVIGKESSVSATPLFTAPSNLTAAPGDGQVTLSWDDPKTTAITGYQVSSDGGANYSVISGSGATTTSHTVDNLTNEMPHTFKVRAYDSNAAGPSSQVIAYSVAGPTAAPNDLKATPADGQAMLTWENPGNAAITGYKVSSDGGANYSVISGSGATTTSHTVDNLTNFTAYWFTVRAVNASGAGAPSEAVRAEPGAVPGNVGSPTATPKHERVELSWVDPTLHTRTGGYKVRYKKTNDADWGEWQGLSNPAGTDNELTIYDLTNSESHDFQLLAYNYIGDGPTSELTATPVSKVPAAPTGLSAAPGDGEVTLTWDDPPAEEGKSILGYKVSFNDFVSYGSADEPSYTYANLTNGTEYSFKVRANNSAGDSLSSEVKKETPLFAAPKGLQASPGGRQVTLTWDDPVIPLNNNITGYALRIDDGEFAAIANSGATTTEHTVTGLDGGTAKRFAVRAVNGVAGTVSATPLFASPADLTALVGDQQITLNWTNPGNTNINGYEVSSDNGTNYTPISLSDDTTNSHNVQNLSNGTEYTFAVRAVNCPANGAPAMVKATPLFPAPTGLTATAGYGEVALGWHNPNNASITGYQVSSDGGTNYRSITGSDAGTTSHTVTGLAGGTSYTFAVRAVYGASATATATPLFATPTAVATEEPTQQPVVNTPTPTAVATEEPTQQPGVNTPTPTTVATEEPTQQPGVNTPTPTAVATEEPTQQPGVNTPTPTTVATEEPTQQPGVNTPTPTTVALSPWPTAVATEEPTQQPVVNTPTPTAVALSPWPTAVATEEPTQQPGVTSPTPTAVALSPWPTAVATEEPTQQPGVTSPTPTAVATEEPTQQPGVTSPTPTAVATVIPLPRIGQVMVTPTEAPVVGPTPLPTATPTPGLTATVVPRGTLEPTARPTATPAGTPVEETPSRITDSPLVPVGIVLFALLIAALAAFILGPWRRRKRDRDGE